MGLYHIPILKKFAGTFTILIILKITTIFNLNRMAWYAQ